MGLHWLFQAQGPDCCSGVLQAGGMGRLHTTTCCMTDDQLFPEILPFPFEIEIYFLEIVQQLALWNTLSGSQNMSHHSQYHLGEKLWVQVYVRNLHSVQDCLGLGSPSGWAGVRRAGHESCRSCSGVVTEMERKFSCEGLTTRTAWGICPRARGLAKLKKAQIFLSYHMLHRKKKKKVFQRGCDIGSLIISLGVTSLFL